jgi:tRNA(Ile)-lysidine synthetase-like protein
MGDQHTDPGPATGSVAKELAAACRRLELAPPVLVAASGGLDSTVLAHGLAGVLGPEAVILGHVHHGLRGAEADADAAAVEALAERLGCRYLERRIAPHALREGASSRDRLTLQEAAREGRYVALAAMAEQVAARAIATAHHADDQAETVLLRILRGTGPDGLGGIPERSSGSCAERARTGSGEFPSARPMDAWSARCCACRVPSSRPTPKPTGSPGARTPRTPPRPIPGTASDGTGCGASRRPSTRTCSGPSWIWPKHTARTRIGSRSRSRANARVHEALARRIAREALVRGGAGRHVSRTHLLRVVDFLSRKGPGRILELPGGIRIERDRAGFRLGPLPGTTGGSGPAC